MYTSESWVHDSYFCYISYICEYKYFHLIQQTFLKVLPMLDTAVSTGAKALKKQIEFLFP